MEKVQVAQQAARRSIAAIFITLLTALILGFAMYAPQRAQAVEPAGYLVDIKLKGYGTISVALDRTAAPKTVDNFVKLITKGGNDQDGKFREAPFYNGLNFHRIEKGFVMQGGDPKGNGQGGSDTKIYGEFAENGWNNPISHTRGTISMARSDDPNSASSQFFICYQDATYLDGKYAAFGHVVGGMEIVDAICDDSNFMNFGSKDKPNWLYIRSKPVIEDITILPSASGAGWHQSGGRWWYSYESAMRDITGQSYPRNGWAVINGHWYNFDKAGWMNTGWKRIGSTWYWLGSDGAMKTGWQYVNGNWYYMDTSGAMKTGWQEIGSDWYYLKSSGAMKVGWHKSSGKWYYLNPAGGGAMATGLLTWINDGYYLLNWDGTMSTGWQKVNDDWYCFSASGPMRTGWIKSSGKWYYCTIFGMQKEKWIEGKYWVDKDGIMATNAWVDNDKHYVGSNGVYKTGWVSVGGKWYYITNSGKRTNQWIGGKYWVGEDGVMATNAWVDDGKYYVNADGVWVKNAKKPAAESSSSSATQAKTVYWVDGGEVYHTTNGCSALSRSSNIQSGTVDQATKAGKSRVCKDCS